MLYANLCLFLRKQKGLFGSNMYCRMSLQLLGTLERRRGALCPFASFCIYGLWKNSNYTATKSSATIALYRSFAVH